MTCRVKVKSKTNQTFEQPIVNNKFTDYKIQATIYKLHITYR